MTEFTQYTQKNLARSLTNLPGLDLEWQMTNCERFALASLLERLEPELSLEIGSYRGGSLQVLSRYSKKVISLESSHHPSKSSRKHSRLRRLVSKLRSLGR
jgi:hypothetical protein